MKPAPGDAGLALAVAYGEATVAHEDAAWVQSRLERPEPRLAQGLQLRGIASAAIDISDGLAQDLGHILEQRGEGATGCGSAAAIAGLNRQFGSGCDVPHRADWRG